MVRKASSGINDEPRYRRFRLIRRLRFFFPLFLYIFSFGTATPCTADARFVRLDVGRLNRHIVVGRAYCICDKRCQRPMGISAPLLLVALGSVLRIPCLGHVFAPFHPTTIMPRGARGSFDVGRFGFGNAFIRSAPAREAEIVAEGFLSICEHVRIGAERMRFSDA